MNEMVQVAEVVRRELQPDPLNYTVSGNVVASMHWHINPRFDDDPDCGEAPWRWNKKTPAPDDAKALAAVIAAGLEMLWTDD